MLRAMLALALLAVALPARPGPALAGTREAVYVNLADSLQGSFDELTGELRTAFGANGWQVLAVHEVAVEPRACAYRARVFVVHHPEHDRWVLAHGPRAAFALPPRLVLFEDERGTHLATVNPLSVDRTIVAEAGVEAESRALVQDLSRTAAGAVRGRFALRPFGQVRDRGLIGRTMGIMAGGPFVEKLKEVYSTPATSSEDVARVADQVWKGIEAGGRRGHWQLGAVYRLDLATQGVVVIGVSGAAMEAKSFAIVGAGNDDTRAGLKCAGLAHAAAYPLEVVVFRDGGVVRVCVLDGMYRMKMFFEDAGKMKFAANMGMPGSIEDELRRLVLAGVAPGH